MYSWGRCENGQLGLGGIPDVEVSLPRAVPENPLEADSRIVDVKAGEAHTVILSSDGKVFSCGSHDYGQVS